MQQFSSLFNAPQCPFIFLLGLFFFFSRFKRVAFQSDKFHVVLCLQTTLVVLPHLGRGPPNASCRKLAVIKSAVAR